MIATAAELLSVLAPRQRRIAEAARQRVLQVVPHAVERLRPGWRLLGYDAPRYFAFIAPHHGHVRLGFEWGVRLDDPTGLLEGEGSRLRWVTLRTLRLVQAPAVGALLRRAAGQRFG